MPSPNHITVNQLARLIGTPDAPVIIDLCLDDDFGEDPRVLPTAFRYPFKQITSLTDQLHGKRVVVYCQKGKKISEGGAAQLRAVGIQAELLEGGHYAWRDANLPLIPFDKIPTHAVGIQGTLWVTRHRPKIDRIACAWLIRRFVDPAARFLFVAPATVVDVAEKFDATPFDVEDVFYSHRDDHCTFDTMLKEFKLDASEVLQQVAVIVRGADTDQHDLAPQCAGLLALSLGLSRMYKDDLAQLEAGLLIYDALYRWARDARNEVHDWPGVKTSS